MPIKFNGSHAIAALLMSGSPPALAEQSVYDGQKIESITTRLSCGTIRTTESSDNKIHIKIEKARWGDYCTLKTKATGSGLFVNVTENKALRRTRDCCELSIDLKIPKNKNLDFKALVGNYSFQATIDSLKISGTSGSIDIENSQINTIKNQLASGSVTIKNSKIPNFHSKIGAGNLSAKGTFQKISHHLGSGNTDMTFIKVPDSGTVDFNTGSGNTSVHFPKDSQIRFEMTSTIGNLENQFSNSPNSNFKVKINSAVGNTSVKKY